MTVRLTHCDNCTLRISAVNGTLAVGDIRVISDFCHTPVGEITNGIGYIGGDPTYASFRQVLIPPSSSIFFGGRKVRELNPGGGGPDTCDVPGDSYLPWTSVTGGTWIVAADNSWHYDTIGWGVTHTEYYRSIGQAPCETTFPQRMQIDCGDTWVPYTMNTLGSGIDPLSVWSVRALVLLQRVWP
jgi:hypothetical protein